MEAIDLKFLFQILLTCLGTLTVYLFNKISRDISRMTDSVESLNIKVAVVCEKIENHDARIRQLEGKK